jgi:hypothetical protein
MIIFPSSNKLEQKAAFLAQSDIGVTVINGRRSLSFEFSALGTDSPGTKPVLLPTIYVLRTLTHDTIFFHCASDQTLLHQTNLVVLLPLQAL